MMSDTPNETLPGWLTQGNSEDKVCPHGSPLDAHGNAPLCNACKMQEAMPAFSLAAPPEAVAAAIATEPGPLTDEAVRQNGLPLPEVSPIETAAVADVLIKFKRFWNAADNTSNELDAALECARYFVGMVKYADQSK